MSQNTRRNKRAYVRDLQKQRLVKYKELEQHKAFILSLNTQSEEDIEKLKKNEHENNFIQMWFNAVQKIHNEIITINMTIDALSIKKKNA
jgi:hypothetical protein